MTRSVTLALLACAVGAWASAKNGPKPEKALGKKGCDICSGGTVDAYTHAGGYCEIADDVFPTGPTTRALDYARMSKLVPLHAFF